MNLAELVQAVYAALRDTTRSAFAEADVIALLNDAYRDLTARLELLATTKTGTTSPATIPLPSGDDAEVHRITRLRLAGADVESVDDDVFHSWLDIGTTPPVTLARVIGTTIELHPAPTTATAYKLEYIAIPGGTGVFKLLADPSAVPAITPDLHRKLVYHAQAHAKYALGEPAEGDRYLALYENGLPPPALAPHRHLRPEPWSLTLWPSGFDTDPDRMHT